MCGRGSWAVRSVVLPGGQRACCPGGRRGDWSPLPRREFPLAETPTAMADAIHGAAIAPCSTASRTWPGGKTHRASNISSRSSFSRERRIMTQAPELPPPSYMRRDAFHPTPELREIPGDTGFAPFTSAFGPEVYLVTRHEEVKACCPDHQRFSTSPAGFVVPGNPEVPRGGGR